ncbi:MAG: hypothetical protein AB4368_12335 [Xenococcaceae cyanobacterium]
MAALAETVPFLLAYTRDFVSVCGNWELVEGMALYYSARGDREQ